MDDPPAGWEVWNEGEDGRLILAYRPDVFDGDAFPAACMPTLYCTRGRRNSRRPGPERDAAADWFVTLFLEPEVTVAEERFDRREDALDRLRTVAADFAEGAIDYRDSYQVPRDDYLDELDALTEWD
ncbi:hypothetical protein L593_08265 [Salinarchaeum sp. Harcht-Bsk1]|uniref:DUF5820 family protein n=1 Tax=Salinarchaeum sp. Harcht-Bsk1 TaxID=1333523 RepID=UPI0003422F46|nr:DUF5820 family protein [Salinarchaeum sp. Harcht-Bsk1]AGN01598.1 hypothetical protein L593_08265 [Salinarchaeum sp. Harcht-Bsk1]